MPKYPRMVCLVGENPLPVYLGILQYAAKDAVIVLVHSGKPGTLPVAERIARLVRRNKEAAGISKEDRGKQVTLPPKVDAYDPKSVMRMALAHRGSGGDTVLNYTGGTKVMSAFSILSWFDGAAKDKNGLPEVMDAIYLEEESHGFRLADGTWEAMETERPLTLQDVFDLHEPFDAKPGAEVGFEAGDLLTLFKMRHVYYPTEKRDGRNSDKGPHFYNPVGASDKEKAFRAIANWRSKSSDQEYSLLNDQFNRIGLKVKPGSTWHRAITNLLRPNTQQVWLNTEYPNSDKAYSDFRVPPGVESPLAARVGFLQAKWLEHYVAYMLQYLGPDRKFSWEVVPADAPFGSTNVRSGQYFNIRSRLFEADVVALHGNRIRYISVTTSHDKNVCQGKLFEAMHRARQIGGGLASAAVVCLLERTPCTSIWMSTGKDENHQVFGCDELDLWEKGKVSLDFYNWLTK